MTRQGMDWEAELRRLATADAHISLPNAREIEAALRDIETALGGTAKEGLEGTAGETAAAAFDADARDAVIIRDDVRRVMEAVDRANNRRQHTADAHLRELESGFPEKLEWWQETLLRGAAVGSTWALGPFSFVVADGVVDDVNGLLAAQRNARAREGVQAVSAAMDEEAASFTSERRVVTKRSGNPQNDAEDYTPPAGGGPGDGGGGPGTSSFDTYPQDPSTNDVPPPFTYNPPVPDDGGNDPVPPTFPKDPTVIGPFDPPRFVTDPPFCPTPDPDGPTVFNPDDPTWHNPDDFGPWSPENPTVSLPDGEYPPGYDPNDPSTWGTGGRGGLTSDSSMTGGSHAWGSSRGGAGIGALGSGALGSGAGVGGSGAFGGIGGGAGSAALLGGAGGAVSLAGAKLMQTGGPGMGSGLLGSQGAAGAGAGAGAGAASRGGAMGMMGGTGGGATEKKSRPGLSGLRAPQLEGDDDPTPRSEAAGAGGRES